MSRIRPVFSHRHPVLSPHHWRSGVMAIALGVLLGCAGAPQAFSPSPDATEAPGVPGVTAEKLTAEYWVSRLSNPDDIVLDEAYIAAQNARLLAQDSHVLDLNTLPASLKQDAVLAKINATSSLSPKDLFTIEGKVLSGADRAQLGDSLALDALPEEISLRFGLITQRANLRAFPTSQRVFSRIGDTDIDRFQESALFPGSAVAILHSSRDGKWLFVSSRLYSAWVEAQFVALGDRDTVLNYAQQPPYLVVTGAQASTVFTPEAPAVSELALDMGVRLPLWADWPMQKPVNGQFAYASHVVALPVRSVSGMLEFVPALVPRSADVRTDYLPLTRANLLRQSFKFLGERYGWGHSYGTRDCSGFVSEVYRSFGVEMPRNTSAQGVSPAFNRIAFDEKDRHEQRIAILKTLDVGDLIYIPGHVMMVIGHDDDELWLIHDTTGIRYRTAAGDLVSIPLNQVAVTPLFSLLGESGTPFVDFIYSVQRIRLTSSP